MENCSQYLEPSYAIIEIRLVISVTLLLLLLFEYCLSIECHLNRIPFENWIMSQFKWMPEEIHLFRSHNQYSVWKFIDARCSFWKQYTISLHHSDKIQSHGQWCVRMYVMGSALKIYTSSLFNSISLCWIIQLNCFGRKVIVIIRNKLVCVVMLKFAAVRKFEDKLFLSN